jgi:hypothetical protein
MSATRRALFGIIPAVLMVGAAARAAPATTEAERIRLCNRLVGVEAEQIRLFETDMDGDALDKAVEPLGLEMKAIMGRLYELGNPVTPAGMVAFTKAALADGVPAPDVAGVA